MIEQGAVVRVAQPAGVAPAELCQQLRSGSYDEPFLVEDCNRRTLRFAIDGSIQSEMRLDDPDDLVNAYTRKMMAFLLFCPRPRSMLMIGLGGGSLAKFCHRHLPATCITAVEIDASVIALRTHFRIPPDDSRLSVIHGDGAQHVADMAAAGESTDVLLVDAYDRRGIARAVTESCFLENSRRALSDRGVFVMNLAAYESECDAHVRMIRSVFGEPVIPVTVGWGGNTVVFAGPALRNRRRLAAAPLRALRVRATLDLHFPRLPELVSEYLRQAPRDSATVSSG